MWDKQSAKMALGGLSLLLLAVVQAVPSLPHWPAAWAAHWNVHSKIGGRTHYAKGWTVYEEKTGEMVWSTTSAWSSEACSSALPQETDAECRQILQEGQRYIYFPSLAHCCQCVQQLLPFPLSSLQYQHSETYFGKPVYTWRSNNFTYFETQHADPLQRQWTAFFSPDRVYTTVYNWTLDVQAYDFHLPPACSQAAECVSGPCSRHASSIELKDLFSLYSHSTLSEHSACCGY